ncbi:MAG: RraA family protein [Eubacteriales bacterium]|nr:RraA family protein [Clostridiales bacterium]MDD7302319.1 RraA family protein [Eubacteriales bacterium]MDY4435875.1 RraA family protein [Candidatus Flemingibacterium sp.]
MDFNVKEDIIALTPQWKGERFPDGRPRVPDRYLEALRGMTLEEVWKPIFVKGYESQFEGRLHTLHDDGRKLVGRAVTATFAPTRPDLHEVMFGIGMKEGRKGNYNQWVVDSLVDGDVLVIDMYDKIYKGTFLGGNLTTAVKTKTKTGGAVIWGGVRDVEQMKQVEGVQVYYRGIDPTPIRDFLMTGFNTPTRLGNAIVLPGDIVFGAGGGVLFIPAHLVPEVVDGAAKTHVKDIFGFEMITQNVFTTAQIDKNTWTEDMLDLLVKFIKEDPRGEEYRDLDWSKEYDLARNGDPNDTQTAL